MSEVGKAIDYFDTTFNTYLRKNIHIIVTSNVPQNRGFRMSIRNKFKLIMMNEIWDEMEDW